MWPRTCAATPSLWRSYQRWLVLALGFRVKYCKYDFRWPSTGFQECFYLVYGNDKAASWFLRERRAAFRV